MKSHWIKRIVRLLVLLFGVSILCFILTALSSTDPATYLVRRGNLSPTPEVIEQVRAELAGFGNRVNFEVWISRFRFGI